MKRKLYEYVDNKYQPMWLPQVSADHEYVTKSLDTDNIPYTIDTYNPTDLKPLQRDINIDTKEFFSKKINNREPIDLIYIANGNEILDGHNRNSAYIENPAINKVVCVKILMDYKDAARILNKIQDKFEWDGEKQLQETESNKNSVTMELYSNKPIDKRSKCGNFMIPDNKKGYDHKYEIEFDNLHDFNTENNNPIEALAEEWLGNLNTLKEESVKHVLTYETYLLRKLAEEAKKRGYDGISYNNKIIQTIN
jgi:hypothetical protein